MRHYEVIITPYAENDLNILYTFSTVFHILFRRNCKRKLYISEKCGKIAAAMGVRPPFAH